MLRYIQKRREKKIKNMKKMLYIFVGDSPTGKSNLAFATTKFRIFDGFNCFETNIRYLMEQLKEKEQDTIFVTNDLERISSLLFELQRSMGIQGRYNITKVFFEQLR